MTTNDQHDDNATQQPPANQNSDESPPDAGTATRSLVRATRAMAPVDQRSGAHVATAALRERVGMLVGALGDPTHPLHQRAVNDLVALGDPAVPALIEALHTNQPWLTSYRATEALGQIGDGRAAGPLVAALDHPNSNVRWGAVRALATVGDARALLELRRVAQTDRSKTSWGESVGDVARLVLDQMQGRTLLVRVAELVKTALACVIMLVSLILAWSVVTELRDELAQVGRAEPAPVIVAPLVRTAVPQAIVTLPTAIPTATAIAPVETPLAPEGTPPPLAGVVVASGNVRAAPTIAADNVIGSITAGDQVEFLATTPDGTWYRIRLGPQASPASEIRSADGSGWVSDSLVGAPEGELPVETPPAP